MAVRARRDRAATSPHRRFRAQRPLIRMTRFIILIAFALTACTDDAVSTSQYAVDVDHSGGFDCADLDAVHACIYPHLADACALADVNHDGVVDDLDVHDISSALHDSGHDCTTH